MELLLGWASLYGDTHEKLLRAEAFQLTEASH